DQPAQGELGGRRASAFCVRVKRGWGRCREPSGTSWAGPARLAGPTPLHLTANDSNCVGEECKRRSLERLYYKERIVRRTKNDPCTRRDAPAAAAKESRSVWRRWRR